NTPVVAGASVGIPVIPVCGGGLRTLNLEGNSFGTGQTYQWQSSSTINGTYTNVSSALVVPLFDINPTTDLYYRAVVTCAGSTATSDPIQITIRNPLNGTYSINSNANTSATNFKSFEDVVAALNCGIAGPVVLNVAAGSGPYNEQVIINAVAGSSAANTITINGNGATLTYLSANTNERATLKLNGADYVTVDNLVITAQGTTSSQYGIGVHILNDADYNVISNCTINVAAGSTSPNYSGIWINASDNDGIGGADSKCDFNKISGNTVTGGYYGILLSSDPTVAKMNYDTVINNNIRDQHIYGLYVRGTDHALIEGNTISRPNRTITGTYIAVYLNGISTSLQVSKNRIHTTHGAISTGTDATTGISSNNCDATAGNENIISNNIIYNFGGLGAQIGINNSGSDFALYLHNTISLERQVGTPTSTARAFYQTTAATGLQYRNNIVTIKRNGTGTNHAVYMNTPATAFVASNNNYLVAGTGTNRTGFRNNTQYISIADWQGGSGSETNSLAYDPLYTSLATGNLYPNNLALDNRGIVSSITTDITNITRNAGTPDIGAYEFAGTLPVKLLNISARFITGDVLVKWTTLTEQNARHFVVQRSTDGLSFTDAGIVAAAGNSNSQLNYQFTDVKNALPAANVLYYRLAMVDIDGRLEYSDIVPVQVSNEKFAITVQPNPFVAKLTASIATATAGRASIQLTDAAGKVILKQVQPVNAGTTVFDIDKAAQLQSGVYFISIEVNGSRFIQKLIK
ncbi:MAG: T9SS type A sorting domain-containing protein, partial [Sphingobacteriales bacterium]